MELNEEFDLDWYTPEFRSYDPQLGRFHQIDPVVKHHESLYAWNTNNPISFNDPLGSDSTQRANAIAKAQEFVDQNTGNTWENGAKGGPGQNVDCSGLVTGCVVAGGESNPNRGNSNGVTNIANNTDVVDESDVVPGNLVILNGSSHIGIITSVERDDDGNITNLQMIDSGGDPDSGTSGPRETSLITDGTNGYWGDRIDSFRKFDTKPDATSGSSQQAAQVSTSQSSTGSSTGRTRSRSSGLSNAWSNFKSGVASFLAEGQRRILGGT